MKTTHNNNLFKLLKAFALYLTLFSVLLTVFASCDNNQNPSDTTTADTSIISDTPNGNTTAPDDETRLNIMVLNGTTGMGAASMISEYKKSSDPQFIFEIVSAADIITAAIISGEADIAAVPTNLAAVLYNKTNGNIKVAAVNTKGVLYIIENGQTIKSFADLNGKTVYVPGAGTNPEYILKYLCEKNGLRVGTDIIIDGTTYPSPDELATAVSSGNADIALLPEPKVTAVCSKAPTEISIAIDITEEWEIACGKNNTLLQGCIIVRNEIINEHPQLLNKFLEEYKESVELVNEYPEKAAEYIEEAGIIPSKALAQNAIPKCNICYIDSDEMKTALDYFFKVLYDMNPKAVGGTVPDDNLYYMK